MKKFIAILALLALASASFAMSITDWYAYDYFVPVPDADYISDYGNAGAAINVNPVPDTLYGGLARFGSDNVSDWVYDENGEFSVLIEGFEDLYPADSDAVVPPVRMFVVVLGSDGDYARHQTEWSGSGNYYFGPETLDSYFFDIEGPADIESVEVYFAKDNGSGWFDIYYLGNQAVGTIEFFGIEEEPDEPVTEVPEPAAFAYAAMGLASVFGLKRRIKK